MREIRKSGSMSGEGKRSDADWPKLPRPSSTLLLPPWIHPPAAHSISPLPCIWERAVDMAEKRVQRRLVAILVADTLGDDHSVPQNI